MDDVELTLTLSGGSKKNGPPAKQKMTSVEVTLDICEPRTKPKKEPKVLPTAKEDPKPGKEKDKFFLGRPLPLQGDPKIDERAMLIVQKVKPEDFAGSITLRLKDDKIALFNAETPAAGEAAVADPHTFAISTIPNGGLRLFVEGAKLSGAARDTGVTAELAGGSGEILDEVRVSVCHTEIVSGRKPADVKIVSRVEEKPERKTKSEFFPAPIIVGRNYKVEMRPFIELAAMKEFHWSTESNKLSLKQANKEVVKAEAKKLSAAIDDIDLSVLLTTDIGRLRKNHKLTAVNVEIDPITSGDNVLPTDDINLIKNPAGCVVLAGADAADVKKVPKYEITKFEPALGFTDDDDRISWWILGGDAKADNQYDGSAEFLNSDAAKRGLKIQVHGVTEGDVLIQPYSGGFGYGMIRTHVVPI
jgi:hypothetical protein